MALLLLLLLPLLLTTAALGTYDAKDCVSEYSDSSSVRRPGADTSCSIQGSDIAELLQASEPRPHQVKMPKLRHC